MRFAFSSLLAFGVLVGAAGCSGADVEEEDGTDSALSDAPDAGPQSLVTDAAVIMVAQRTVSASRKIRAVFENIGLRAAGPTPPPSSLVCNDPGGDRVIRDAHGRAAFPPCAPIGIEGPRSFDFTLTFRSATGDVLASAVFPNVDLGAPPSLVGKEGALFFRGRAFTIASRHLRELVALRDAELTVGEELREIDQLGFIVEPGSEEHRTADPALVARFKAALDQDAVVHTDSASHAEDPTCRATALSVRLYATAGPQPPRCPAGQLCARALLLTGCIVDATGEKRAEPVGMMHLNDNQPPWFLRVDGDVVFAAARATGAPL
jgi:hypothetical protein